MKKEKVEPKKKNTNDQMARVIRGYAPEPLINLKRICHTERSEESLTERTDRDSSGKFVIFYSIFFGVSLRMTNAFR